MHTNALTNLDDFVSSNLPTQMAQCPGKVGVEAKTDRRSFIASKVVFTNVVHLIDSVVARSLKDVPGLAALFISDNEDGSYDVFVVVPEHEDAVYDAVVEAEVSLQAARQDEQFEIHVRAHQGRSPLNVVPPGLTQIG